MVSRNFKTEAIKENPHNVDVRQMYNHPSAQIMHITLKAGESLKPHKTPVDVVFYVLEGNPSIQVGDEHIAYQPDTLIESPADIVHCISNTTEQIARVLVIKAPRPNMATKVL